MEKKYSLSEVNDFIAKHRKKKGFKTEIISNNSYSLEEKTKNINEEKIMSHISNDKEKNNNNNENIFFNEKNQIKIIQN